MRNDANARRQSLLRAFLLTTFAVAIDVVGIVSLFLKSTSLLPEAALVGAFAVTQSLGKIRIYAGANRKKMSKTKMGPRSNEQWRGNVDPGR